MRKTSRTLRVNCGQAGQDLIIADVQMCSSIPPLNCRPNTILEPQCFWQKWRMILSWVSVHFGCICFWFGQHRLWFLVQWTHTKSSEQRFSNTVDRCLCKKAFMLSKKTKRWQDHGSGLMRPWLTVPPTLLIPPSPVNMFSSSPKKMSPLNSCVTSSEI